MKSGHPTPLLTNWERFFDAKTLALGRACFDQGQVEDLLVQSSSQSRRPWLISGSVRGSSAKPYAVECTGRSSASAVTQLQGVCSCPVGGQCKHVVAVLQAAATPPPGGPTT